MKIELVNLGVENLKNAETEKLEFRKRLDFILQKSLTVDNINTYANEVLDDLVRLTRDVAVKYREANPKITATEGEIEDRAYSEYNLLGIGDFLDQAQKKLDLISAADSYIKKDIKHGPEIITPPDENKMEIRKSFGGEIYVKPDIKDRLKTLLFVIQEIGVALDGVETTDGILKRDMARKHSYYSVSIPGLNRLVLVCEEERNVSYVFDLERLKLVKVTVEEVNKMTKEEKNEFIEKNKGVGVRFSQSTRWVDRLKIFLTEDLSIEIEKEDQAGINAEKNKNIPQVSKIELDPWKGFWEDPETKKHYSHLFNLSNKAGEGAGTKFIASILAKHEGVARKKIRDQVGKVTIGYAYEEIVELHEFKKFKEYHGVEQNGEWKYFYQDTSGKHYGSVRRIAVKLGNRGEKFITTVINNLKLNSIKVRDIYNRVLDVYCYEDIAAHPDSLLPTVAERGEWAGFYEENDRHWGLARSLSLKIGVSEDTIYAVLKGSKLSKKKLIGNNGLVVDGYSYEEVIERNPHLLERKNLPKAASAGEWAGFFTDESGQRWGTVEMFSRKTGKSRGFIVSVVERSNLVSRNILSSKGRSVEAYSYEDVNRALGNFDNVQ